MSRSWTAPRKYVSRIVTVTVLAGCAVLAARAAAHRGATTVWIDANDAYLPSEEAAYWVFTTPEVQIPLVLSEPATGDGFGVNTVSSLTPGEGTVVFPPGATTRITVRSFGDEPPESFYPGWVARWGYFNLTSAGPNGQVGTPATLYIAWVSQLDGATAGDKCAWSFFEALLCALRITGFCPEGLARGAPSSLGGPVPASLVLQRYRDEILAATTNGQYYVTLYDGLSADAAQAIVHAPALAAMILRAQEEWIPALDALVNGAGAGVTVTPSMEASLLDILQSFVQVGSLDLSSTLAYERVRLELDSIAGLTLDEFQEQIVTLGGPTNVEARSWSDVKGLYKAPAR